MKHCLCLISYRILLLPQPRVRLKSNDDRSDLDAILVLRTLSSSFKDKCVSWRVKTKKNWTLNSIRSNKRVYCTEWNPIRSHHDANVLAHKRRQDSACLFHSRGTSRVFNRETNKDQKFFSSFFFSLSEPAEEQLSRDTNKNDANQSPFTRASGGDFIAESSRDDGGLWASPPLWIFFIA